ncbi:MAG: hypothetical protein SO253_01575 [Bacilli bacterium]|nr:hypothetical protein [Bacilli bacterium]
MTNIVKKISCNSICDSNLFLRKLWSELEEGNGWNLLVYGKNQKIFLGSSNYGMVSFDYEKRGCINNIYFDNVAKKDVDFVKRAIDNAKNIDDYCVYYIKIELPFFVCDIYDDKTYTIIYNENKKSYIYSKIKAYSMKDLNFLLSNKLSALRALFSIYVNKAFPLNRFNVFVSKVEERKRLDDSQSFMSQNDYYIIPREGLIFADLIISKESYSREVRMLINSIHQYYFAISQEEMNKENIVDRLSCINVANSIMVSALEPLASLEKCSTTVCENSNQKNFSVVKKMKQLLSRYLDEGVVWYFMKNYYEERSKFFHEGKRQSEEYYIGICWPQIDETDGRNIFVPRLSIDYNLLNFVNFVIQQRVYDIILDNIM